MKDKEKADIETIVYDRNSHAVTLGLLARMGNVNCRVVGEGADTSAELDIETIDKDGNPDGGIIVRLDEWNAMYASFLRLWPSVRPTKDIVISRTRLARNADRLAKKSKETGEQIAKQKEKQEKRSLKLQETIDKLNADLAKAKGAIASSTASSSSTSSPAPSSFAKKKK